MPNIKKMKSKNNFVNKSERLPKYHKNLIYPKSFFISKHNITLKYTETLRKDIKELMKIKNIGWTELSRQLRVNGYRYNPNAIQNYVNGNTWNAKDIKYFVPIVILLNT